MKLYTDTVQIVAGVLTPFVVLALIVWAMVVISDIVEWRKRDKERELEREHKAPPYDDIEFSQPPNPTMITVRLIKDGKSVWEQSYDKGDLK